MVEKWKRWDLFLVAAVAGLGSVRAEPQFTLTLRTSPDGEEAVVVTSNAVAATVSGGDGISRHEWKFAAGSPVERAEAIVRTSGDETRYRLSVKVADGWHLERRSFPEIKCAKIRLGGEGREVAAVCAAAYRADDGEEAVVLANATWSGQKVEMTWNGRDKSVVVGAGDIVVVGWPIMHGL